MKVVIIGGGIAGLSLGMMLSKHGIKISICEKEKQMVTKGHAFLLHPNAVKVLKNISTSKTFHGITGTRINSLQVKSNDDRLLSSSDLSEWMCMKRVDLVSYLSVYVEENLKYNRAFSHFLKNGDKTIAAVFENGDVEYGDFFIGADGAHSRVRKAMFGEVKFTKVEVNEVVGLVKPGYKLSLPENTFTKFVGGKGVAIGLIPYSEEEIIWFLQFDIRLRKLNLDTPHFLEKHCRSLLAGFPEIVHKVLDVNDFASNYIWQAKDFDLLASFGKDNTLLIGDAAHLSLPFSSAGTTDALNDAELLAELLVSGNDLLNLCSQFYERRAGVLKEHLEKGRTIKQDFLTQQDEYKTVPLIN